MSPHRPRSYLAEPIVSLCLDLCVLRSLLLAQKEILIVSTSVCSIACPSPFYMSYLFEFCFSFLCFESRFLLLIEKKEISCKFDFFLQILVNPWPVDISSSFCVWVAFVMITPISKILLSLQKKKEKKSKSWIFGYLIWFDGCRWFVYGRCHA